MTAGPQRLPGPLVADGGIDPVPGGGRVHQAERVWRPPLLERGPHHLDLEPGQVLPGHRGQLRAELDAGDPVAAPRQRAGRLAGRAPHLEQVVARRQAGQRDEIVVQRPGILRPDPVVPRGGRVERPPQSLTILIRLHPAILPPMPGSTRAVIIGNVVLL